jgi:hypothetical protein
MPSAYPSRVAAVRFDVFPKFDLRAGELRNRGVKVNVQPFPSPPGPFRTFWRSGNQGNNCERKSGLLNTFVDFDQGLKGGVLPSVPGSARQKRKSTDIPILKEAKAEYATLQ